MKAKSFGAVNSQLESKEHARSDFQVAKFEKCVFRLLSERQTAEDDGPTPKLKFAKRMKCVKSYTVNYLLSPVVKRLELMCSS